ncbi:unnamed protein product, partial [Vitis vinifera]
MYSTEVGLLGTAYVGPTGPSRFFSWALMVVQFFYAFNTAQNSVQSGGGGLTCTSLISLRLSSLFSNGSIRLSILSSKCKSSTLPLLYWPASLNAKTRECRKMCVNAGNCCSEAHEILSPLGHPLFILDEVGHASQSTFELYARMHIETTSCSISLNILSTVS